MADIFYVPPQQKRGECRYLERNYLACILQKAMKDRISQPICDMQGVLYFHLECPNYVEKFDGPEAKAYIKRSIFSMLLLPYIYGKTNQNARKVNHFSKILHESQLRKYAHIPYPEEYKSTFDYDKNADLNNPELYKRHKEFYLNNYSFMGLDVDVNDKFSSKIAEPDA